MTAIHPHPTLRLVHGWRAPVLIVVVCAAAHLWCLGSQFYLDDLAQIRDNTNVRNGTWWNSRTLLWSYLWYVIEARVFGMSPVGYHLVNWLLHTSVALVLYFSGRRFLANCGGATAALAGALLFAAHPLGSEIPNYARTQDIAWVTLFSLSAAWMSVRFLDTRKWVFLLASVLLAMGATLSKGPGLLHALMMILVAVAGFSNRDDLRWLWRKKWWGLAGAVLLVGLLFLVTNWWSRMPASYFTPRLGWQALSVSRVFWHFAALTAVPVGLCADHHFAVSVSWADKPAVAALAGLILWLLAGAWLLFRPRFRELGGCALLFAGAIAMRVLFFGGEFMPEYRIYPGLPWVCLGVGALAFRGMAVKRVRKVIVPAFVVVVAVFAILSAQRSFQWHSLERLTDDTLAQYPGQVRAIWVMQREDLDKGRPERVLERQEEFMEAAAAARAFMREKNGVRDLGFGLFLFSEVGCQALYAEALAATAGPDAGLAHAERIRGHLEKNQIPPNRPHWGEYHHSLGLILEKAGRLEEAAEALRKTRMINGMDLDLERIEGKLRKRDEGG